MKSFWDFVPSECKETNNASLANSDGNCDFIHSQIRAIRERVTSRLTYTAA